MSKQSFVVVFVAFLAMGFVAAHGPSILNDTDAAVQLEVKWLNKEAAVTLQPHTNYVQGKANQVFSRLVVQFPGGRKIILDHGTLKKLRGGHAVERELWVIHTNSVELLDAREWRRFYVR